MQFSSSVSSRVKRWCFTVNNPVFAIPYHDLLCDGRVKRYVFGVERGENTGTIHLQGYLEFNDPARFTAVAKLLAAHWESAKGSAAQNYKYCCKDGLTSSNGNWDSEIKYIKHGKLSGAEFSYADLIKDLLGTERTSARLTGQYIRHRNSIDAIVSEIRELQVRHRRFVESSLSFVSSWQSTCIVHLLDQPSRRVCWVVDEVGGQGKSYLAHLLHHVYSFDLFDGVTKACDVAQRVSEVPRGFVFDVTRSSKDLFSYHTLEQLKTGFIMSGKYQGIKRMFDVVPVIVFANFEPDTSRLSADRWCIHKLSPDGQAPLHPLPREPVSPPPLPSEFQTPVVTPQQDTVRILQD